MRRGEVHWVYFPHSGTGSEIAKTRPAIILTADSLLGRVARVQVVPLTSNTSRVFAGEAIVTVRGRAGRALASQIATVDAARVLGYYDRLSEEDLAAVEAAVCAQLGLPSGE